MRRSFPAALALVPILGALGACGRDVPPPPVAPAVTVVTNAWVRLPAIPGRPGAAYFTLTGGENPVRLVAVESPRVATIELHESMAAGEGGAGGGAPMTMRSIPHVDLPAAGTVAFAPGGRHAMLFGIAPDVRAGATLPLAFRFADGTRIATAAKAVAAGDPAPAP